MKIIYYSPHPNLNLSSPSGPGTHMREVIKGFESMGHEVVSCILGGTEEADLQIDYSESGLKKFIKKLLPESIWQSMKDRRLIRFDRYAKKQLESLVEVEKPDMIYERGYYLMTSGVQVAEEHDITHAIELNAPYPEEKLDMEGASLFVRLSHEKEKIQVTKTDLVVVVSSALKTYIQEKYDIEGDKILVVPNAVNPEKFRGVAYGSGRFPVSSTVIGFVGSIFPYHGVDKLIEGFAQLANEHEDLRLLIVGDGHVLASLKNLTAELGIEEKVIFTGNVVYEEVYTLISEMDICVMATSNWYGSPVKIFEYGIMNKAVIAPDNIPVNDVMVHEEHGLLCDDSRISLTNAMRRLVKDENLRLTLAANFHDKVLKDHTWAQVSKKILNKMSERKSLVENSNQRT